LKHHPSFFNKRIWCFIFFTIALLSTSRIVFLLSFGDFTGLDRLTILDLFVTGFRFDIKFTASVVLLLVVTPKLVFSAFKRTGFQHAETLVLSALIFLTVTLVFIEYGYCIFFGTTIDQMIFGLFEDDTNAVIQSIVSKWRLVALTVAYTGTICALLWLARRIDFKRQEHRSAPQFFKTLLIVSALIGCARGSLGTFPLSRKTVLVSDNSFINSLALNAPFNLYYAAKDRSKNSFRLTSRQLLKKNGIDNFQDLASLAGYKHLAGFKSTTKNNPFLLDHPPHVIFVLMEGWSTHIALAQGRDNDVLGEFQKHAESDYFFTKFFSNANGTNPSIDNILLNSPITPLSQSKAAKTFFEMSNVLPFKKSGYRTIFISGGNSSWRNHNQFWPRQGFEQYLGRYTIEEKYGVHADNPWGVYDEFLFEYIKDTLTESEKQGRPLFSFALTTNNHPPIRLPKSYHHPGFNLGKFEFDSRNKDKISMLSGFHYQTNELGAFLSWLKSDPVLRDKVIVLATGDHPLRGFYNYSAQALQYLRYSVPVYLYIPEKYDSLSLVPKDISGSHEDLFPTLFELSLSDAEYYSFGTPVGQKRKETAYGWNYKGAYIFENGVSGNKTGLYPWDNAEKTRLSKKALPLSEAQKKRLQETQYRNLLKKYLLYLQYEKTAGSSDFP